MGKIGVIDYGCGNLASLTYALKRLRAYPIVSNQISDLEKCDRFILPGVGAFPYAMKQLIELGIVDFLKDKAKNKYPILGICLGMQLLFEKSDEFGGSDGIGILKGHVEKLPNIFPTIPNIGWWELNVDNSDPFLNISHEDTFYFVHSFQCVPDSPDIQLNLAFEKAKVCALVSHNSVTAVQFHPEKSQKSGEKILRHFIKH
ncbi:MAG: imidazole glycerol phosphate synthase subunit HisH [Legionellales bacterium]|nr:imidazole glycerol phosphate synthase subunit HisH [Legionellales bacterium]|tara:strand:- start:1546 stop:2151 length:606 start_codon:yes stop_codon:yes gene_type:complete